MGEVNKLSEDPEVLELLKELPYEVGAQYVMDKEALKEYIRYLKAPILTDERRYNVPVSSGGVVSLKMFTPNFQEAIKDLSDKEQHKLTVLKKAYHKTFQKRNQLKMKAFGATFGNSHTAFTLLDHRRAEIIDLFGRMFTSQEVHKIVVEDFKIPCGLGKVMEFKKAHIEVINQKIDYHKNKHSDLRLSVKRSRLEELTWLYQKGKEKYKRNLSKDDLSVLVKVIEQIRKEVEGDMITINGTFDINIEATVNTHLQKEIFKQVNINQLILARVASKMSVEPVDLISNLMTSYYSKFNGIVAIEDVDFEEVPLVSTVPYDFDKIRSVQVQEENNFKQLKEGRKAEKEKVLVTIKPLDLKQRLLDKINKKNQEVKGQIGDVEIATASIEIERENQRNMGIPEPGERKQYVKRAKRANEE